MTSFCKMVSVVAAFLAAVCITSVRGFGEVQHIIVGGNAYVFEPHHDALIENLRTEGRLHALGTMLNASSPVQDTEPVIEEYVEDDGYQDLEVLHEEEESETPVRSGRGPPWPEALVPYNVSDSLSGEGSIVLTVMKHITRMTCIVFKPRTKENNLLTIKSSSRGCWSSRVGFSPNKNVTVNLGNGCRRHGQTTHELVHALGFQHEHNRPDRDVYIDVLWEHVERRHPFRKRKSFVTPGIPYDYSSVMHYGRYTFSTSKNQTLVPKMPWVGKLGNNQLSELDVRRLNTHYSCVAPKAPM
ncbi:low choriolytic enzyme-like [Oratosquilla oratoria]|uniref:low choriolytic enzyme-like n=1 Tax=Oratosquilla oratoria TaxID=337810 RepID=UPI003F76AA4D